MVTPVRRSAVPACYVLLPRGCQRAAFANWLMRKQGGTWTAAVAPEPAAAPSATIVHEQQISSGTRHWEILHHDEHPIGHGDVSNKATIDDDVSKFLGVSSAPPAVEFIFVEQVQPEWSFLPRWLFGGCGVSFGHSAVSYTRSDGKRLLVNITRGTGEVGEGELVEFWRHPFDYVYGVRGSKGKGGVFSRSMCIVRLQDWDERSVQSIDLYMRAMLESYSSSRSMASWSHAGKFESLLSWLLKYRTRASGNCSDWVSRSMWYAGLLKRPHSFPKAILVDLIESFILEAPAEAPQAHIVYVKQAAAGRRERQWQRRAIHRSLVAPFHFLQNLVYRDVEAFADAVVEIQEDGKTGALRAAVRAGKRRRPRWMVRIPVFRHWHPLSVVALCAVWIAFGYPRADTPEVSEYVARALTAFVLAVASSSLY